MLFNKGLRNKRMCCSRIKKYCSRMRVDQKRTENDVRSFRCSLNSYVVHLSLSRRLGLLIGASLLLWWKILPLALLVNWRLLRADVGIVPCASTLVTVPACWELCLSGCRRIHLHLALSLIDRSGGLILVTLHLTHLLALAALLLLISLLSLGALLIHLLLRTLTLGIAGASVAA